MKVRPLLILLMMLLMISNNFFITSAQHRSDYGETIKAIAQDIAELQSEFPQLKDFSPTKNINLERLSISYQFHTHQAERRGGWTSGVPNPDDDGIWFYIDIHSPDSRAQIHTQPMTAPICFQDQRVSFLILQGKQTNSVEARIWAILKKHGVTPCNKE